MECSNYKYKKRSFKKVLLIILFIICFLLGGFFCYLKFYVNPIIISANENVIKANSISAINQAVQETLLQSDLYSELVDITYGSNNNITGIIANSSKANKINSIILEKAQEKLNEQTNLGFDIPLGTFSGISIFNGLGPNINIKIVPVGNIQSVYNSKFTSVGINQTHHEIFLNISANVSMLLPGNNQNIKINTQILLAESIIVGEVPQVYLSTNNLFNNTLNLVP